MGHPQHVTLGQTNRSRVTNDLGCCYPNSCDSVYIYRKRPLFQVVHIVNLLNNQGGAENIPEGSTVDYRGAFVKYRT